MTARVLAAAAAVPAAPAVYGSPTLAADPAAMAAQPSPFSAMTAGGAMPGWRVLRPAAGAPDTRYTLVRDGEAVVVRAEADRSMSGLVHSLRIPPSRLPVIRWRWRVAATVEGGDPRARQGDDYAARLYLIFDYPAERLPFTTRAKLRLAELLHGEPVPTAAVNYVWDDRQPVGTRLPNAYTDRARMWVLRSGNVQAGQWVTETRDWAADFRTAFGEAPPDLIGVAIATDTDNTGGRATAWFGDIEFLPAGAGSVDTRR